MSSINSLQDVPEEHTIDFISSEVTANYSYFFRKIYLPAAILRLSRGENIIGNGTIHMTGRGVTGYHEARDYFHGSPSYDQTLKSLQGFPNDQIDAAVALGLSRSLPDVAQVIGLQIDTDLTTDHYSGKYYTVNSDAVPAQAVDQNSRLGLYRLLGEPSMLDWFVEDIDPSAETVLRLHHMDE